MSLYSDIEQSLRCSDMTMNQIIQHSGTYSSYKNLQTAMTNLRKAGVVKVVGFINVSRSPKQIIFRLVGNVFTNCSICGHSRLTHNLLADNSCSYCKRHKNKGLTNDEL